MDRGTAKQVLRLAGLLVEIAPGEAGSWAKLLDAVLGGARAHGHGPDVMARALSLRAAANMALILRQAGER